MKTKYKALLTAAFAAMMFVSCDNVDEGDRYVELPKIESDRAVLVEDFTGQNCINCPDAHEELEALVEQYGDLVVPVSIHAGSFAVSKENTSFPNDYVCLMTKEGQNICDAYGIQQFPMGVVDFGKPITFDLWGTAVRNARKKTTDVTITAKAQFKQTGENAGDIDITADIYCGTSREANIQFWITQDNIVTFQRSTKGRDPKYVHNNVFRAQVFPEKKTGKAVMLEGREHVTVEGSIPLRYNDQERWVAEDMNVVAFVTDKDGIQQVVKVPVEK